MALGAGRGSPQWVVEEAREAGLAIVALDQGVSPLLQATVQSPGRWMKPLDDWRALLAAATPDEHRPAFDLGLDSRTGQLEEVVFRRAISTRQCLERQNW
jgi:hypothetical protein